MLQTATLTMQKEAKKEKPYRILADRRKMTREQWLELRSNYLGGSDVSAVIPGGNRWRTPFQVFAEKKGLVKRQTASEACYFGILFEDLLIKEFTKRSGYNTFPVPFVLQSVQTPWLIADIDSAIDFGNKKFGILEIKTTNTFSGAEEWSNGEIGNVPLEYYFQCQTYMHVTGLDLTYIACLIGGQKFIYQPIQRDQDTIDFIIKVTGAWYEKFLRNVPPPVESNDAAFLSQLYPKAKELKQVELPEAANDILTNYEKANKDLARAKAAKEECEAKLKAMMADAELGVIGTRRISWKNVSTTRLDSKKVKSLLTEDQLKECQNTVVSRKFTIGAHK